MSSSEGIQEQPKKATHEPQQTVRVLTKRIGTNMSKKCFMEKSDKCTHHPSLDCGLLRGCGYWMRRILSDGLEATLGINECSERKAKANDSNGDNKHRNEDNVRNLFSINLVGDIV
ncbi:Hypothetical predicted protein [Olea europaea subsp. europaea]|uniref:Uncharacterized protein n=1 Tax=Olea europaea subsp. europaea TaxID=158383 RepID=A0A8S0QKJ3_OLEEU|nr:Hypothetical predicted protein [Olea europaea subsp. europaea]